MRIAVIADIHGNLTALDAVLEEIRRSGVDEVVVAGDLVNGAPDSLGCWNRIRDLGCPVIKGNHERYVFDLGTERARPEWSTLQFAPVQYAARQFTAEQKQEMASLPTHLRLPGAEDLLIVHASYRNDSDHVYPYTSDEELDVMFSGVREHTIVRGHNHYSGVHLWRQRKVVTTGAAGLPLDGTPRAQFVIMERRAGDWRPRHVAVPYDLAAAARRFHDSGYLAECGPIAKLYLREVQTGSFQIIPFLKFQSSFLIDHKGATFEDAWKMYLKIGCEMGGPGDDLSGSA